MAAKSPEAIAHRKAYYQKYYREHAQRYREQLQARLRDPEYSAVYRERQKAARAKLDKDKDRDYHREYKRKWNLANPELAKEHARNTRARHRDEMNARTKVWHAKHREQQIEYRARYNAENADWLKERRATVYKDRARAYHKHLLATNPDYRLGQLLRARIYKALRIAGTRKADTFWALVGCTLAELKKHLEHQFAPGMTWKNIHIDHIRPLASFDLTDEAQQRVAFHFSNLQPLSPKANMSKGAKWDGQTALTV